MSAGKVNFTSSILSDMAAKAAAFQENKQPEQVVTTTIRQDSEPVVSAPAESTADKPKNNVKRNTIVGLSAVAILIGLGVAGRKGKLGPKLQKFLGGAEHAATNKAGHLQTYRIKLPNTETEFAKLDKSVQEEISYINSVIDRDLLKIDDSLKTITVHSKEECINIIKKEVDLDCIDILKGKLQLNGTYRYVETRGKYEYTIDLNSDKSIACFSKRNVNADQPICRIRLGKEQEYYYSECTPTGQTILLCNEKGEIVSLQKKLSPAHSISYDKNKQIDYVNTQLLDRNGKEVRCCNGYLRCVSYKNGKVSSIQYCNPENGRFAKMEILDDTGKIVKEHYTLADETYIELKATE